ncbi:MAG: phosphoribosylformylglycinamidine cyclo-ligase [Candidatus Omnitrophica bacterium]|nr:phosphoribosylformylglycinamidine cyclo-ligase [Candidatus Omnitrophota bacterium]MDD5429824.1 phosphoribosylformylglycinamidine cyclo-ligase [Candidatus Omnitrophota bacterium]
MKRVDYKKSGVDVKKGELFVKKINVNKSGQMKAFGSLFDLGPLLKDFKNPVLVSSADGVGTKLNIAQKLNVHNTVGIDLVAMNVNDVICTGAKPLFFLDYIACGKLNINTLVGVMKGIKKGLGESDCLLLGGETAEMPGMYKPGEYDLAAFCVGIADKNRIINGKNIKSGDLIIGLESSGLHSNGFSLVRKALGSNGVKSYAKELLKPTRIYVKPILSLLKAYNLQPAAIKGIAHVTGGAFYNKATKILPRNLGMVVERKSWRVPEIFKVIQNRGRIPEKEMYSVFNMGIGMFLVVDSKYAARIKEKLSKKIKVHIIGRVEKSSKKMVLV